MQWPLRRPPMKLTKLKHGRATAGTSLLEARAV
jgi:hypothetical protein